MSWADHAIQSLKSGSMVIIHPRGNSMSPLVESGQRVEVRQVDFDDLSVGDIVLCRVKGNVYLHLIKALDNGRALIGNNKGRTNGWTRTIYGRMIK